MRWLFTIAWIPLLFLPIGVPAAVIDFSESVMPIFKEHCLDCHSANDAEANLVLEDYASLLKGGENGAALVPGKSSESLIIKMLEGSVEKEGKKKIMPPGKRKKLQPAEIASIKQWIDDGAKPPLATAGIS